MTDLDALAREWLTVKPGTTQTMDAAVADLTALLIRVRDEALEDANKRCRHPVGACAISHLKSENQP